MEPTTNDSSAACGQSALTEVLEGCTVMVADKMLHQMGVADYKKYGLRTGTVERVFVPLGGNRKVARVRWHKRGKRGKEFVEVFGVRDLVTAPSNADDKGRGV